MEDLITIASNSISEATRLTYQLTSQIVEKTKELRGYYKVQDIEKNLESNYENDKVEALQHLLSLMSKGEDLSGYFPSVIKNISYGSLKVKKLIYIYLLQYAESEPDLSLLSINTFQKDLNDQNPMIRTVALRVLSSIKVPLIVPIVTMSFKKCSVDISPYVRKAVAISLPKCYRLDDTQLSVLLEILETLLNDNSTIVLGPAVSTLMQIAPDRLDLLHQHYRKFCSSIKDSGQWNQLEIAKVLILYARTFFILPTKHAEIDNDHLLMLESFKPLLKSRNPMVVVMVSDLFFDLDQPFLKELSCKSLIRILYSPQQSIELVLFCIKDIILKDKEPWKKYISKFYIYPDEPMKVMQLKLEIIDSLCCIENSDWVVSQFGSFIYSSNPFLRLSTIKVWRDMAIRLPEIAKQTMKVLLELLSSADDVLVGETIVAIRKLLQEDSINDDTEFPDEELITYLVSIYESITVPLAKSSILWLIGHHHYHHSKALDAVRISLKSFKTQESFLKKQILLMIAVLYVNINSELEGTDSKAIFIRLAYKYCNDMAKLDSDYDVRDLSRFIESLLNSSNPAGKRILAILIKSCYIQQIQEKKVSAYGVGTMSHFFDQKLPGYKALPEWAQEVTGTEERKTKVVSNHASNDVSVEEIVAKKIPEIEKKTVSLDDFYGETSSGSEYETDSE